MALEACVVRLREAAGGELSTQEALDVLEQVSRHRERLAAEGAIDNLDQRLRDFAGQEAERARLAAALQRKQAALNAIARARLWNQTIEHVATGRMTYPQAVLAILEGTTKGIENGRTSVHATQLAFEGRFFGDMVARITQERPHLERLLQDRHRAQPFLEDTLREMYALRIDGAGTRATQNADAQWLADLFGEFAEISRRDLNRLGANIGRLDGWVPQHHDDFKVLRVDAETWVGRIMPRLDVERTFPDLEPFEVVDVLRDIHRTIVTGRDRARPPQPGEVRGPANLAKSLGQHRVLHFRSADDWLAYATEFGEPNVLAAMIGHQRHAARLAGQMQVLGPNPQNMLGALAESLALHIRNDRNIPDTEAAAMIRELQDGARGQGTIGSSMAVIGGLTSRPVNVTAALIGSEVRAAQSAAKLGGAILSSVTDPVIAASNLRFQGKSLPQTWAQLLGGYFQGRGRGEGRTIAYLTGQGFDGLIGNMISPWAAQDAAPGVMSRVARWVFKWSGLTGFTDTGRAAAGRIMAADMGRFAALPHAELPPRYRHVLGLHGIDAQRWEAIRRAAWMGEGGNVYLTPDRIDDLPDEVIDPLIADQLAAVRQGSDEPEIVAAGLARVRDRARLDLELSVRRFYADEAGFSIIDAGDPQTRRLSTWGQRPGTLAGEVARFVMQFKGFPLAFANKVLGRTFNAQPGATRGERALRAAGHFGELMAGLLVAGYAAQFAKDFVRGYWPPRDPTDWKTITSVFAQSGGLGIWGDFVFGQTNRFGNSTLETLAGPAIGAGAKLVNLFQQARDGEAAAGQALSWFLENTPGINLWYTRWGLDWLFLNSLREAASPGFLRRQERNRRRDYGQQRMLPAEAF